MAQSKITRDKAERAHELAEWFRDLAECGLPQSDLMMRTAAALECVASGRKLANDNAPARLHAQG